MEGHKSKLILNIQLILKTTSHLERVKQRKSRRSRRRKRNRKCLSQRQSWMNLTCTAKYLISEPTPSTIQEMTTILYRTQFSLKTTVQFLNLNSTQMILIILQWGHLHWETCQCKTQKASRLTWKLVTTISIMMMCKFRELNKHPLRIMCVMIAMTSCEQLTRTNRDTLELKIVEILNSENV